MTESKKDTEDADATERELRRLAARVTSLERKNIAARALTKDTAARVLVMVATVALFLSLALPWYAEIGDLDESDDLLTGWGVFGGMIDVSSDDVEPAVVFGGWYSIVVVLAAVLGALNALTLRQRWVALTLSPLLVLLAFGHLIVNGQVDEDYDRLAGLWSSLVLMTLTAVAWSFLAYRMRELEFDLQHAG